MTSKYKDTVCEAAFTGYIIVMVYRERSASLDASSPSGGNNARCGSTLVTDDSFPQYFWYSMTDAKLADRIPDELIERSSARIQDTKHGIDTYVRTGRYSMLRN